MSVLLFVILSLIQGYKCDNLLRNPGFENPSSSVWKAEGAELSYESSYHRGGNYSLRVFNRTSSNQGPTQEVPLKPSNMYTLFLHVKQPYHTVTTPQFYNIDITYVLPNGTTTIVVATHPVAPTRTHWIRIQGEFITPAQNFSSSTLRVSGPGPGIEFYIDDVNIHHLVDYHDTLERANNQIEGNRKSKMHLRFTLSNTTNLADYSVKVDLKRHKFGFGVLLDLHSLDQPDHEQLVVDNFNWATVSMQGAQHYDTNQKRALTLLLDKLRGHNIKVRGTGLLDNGTNGSAYLQDLTEPSLKKTILDVMNSVGNSTISKFSHLDLVDNVLRHEMNTGSSELRNIDYVFQTFHHAYPGVAMYLDEEAVLNEGHLEMAFGDNTRELKYDTLGGMGTTVEMSEELNLHLFQERLYHLVIGFGLPLWITDIKTDNVTDDDVKATLIENAIRILFSYSDVSGVTLNPFTDAEHAGLFGGNPFLLTPAGARVLNLINKEWSTHEHLDLKDGTTFNIRGFHGDYDITVYRKSKPIMRTSFTLEDSDLVYTLHIDNNQGETSLPRRHSDVVISAGRGGDIPLPLLHSVKW